jgi:hypothetical protein
MRLAFFFNHQLPLFVYIEIVPIFTKHVPNPSAPSPLVSACKYSLIYSAVNQLLPPVRDLCKVNEVPFGCMHPGVQVVVKLVLLNSMRCTELLLIRVKDEIKPTMFLARGLKRSSSYLVHIPIDPGSRSLLSSLPGSQALFPWTYIQVYRAMIAAGLALNIVSRVNQIVTHRGRYDLADKLQALNDLPSLQPLLHHKSAASASYYVGVLDRKKRAAE